MNLVPCSICQRTFSEEAIERHLKICEKSSRKVRKAFNSENQRKVVDGTVNSFSTKFANKTKPKAVPQKKNNWREKHQEFINNIRAAKGVDQAIKQGKELPPPPPPAANLDYVSCPYCERRFNENAAERHIKFCGDQHKRLEVKLKLRTAVTSKLGETNSASKKKYAPPTLRSSGRSNTDMFNNANSSNSAGKVRSMTLNSFKDKPVVRKGNPSTSSAGNRQSRNRKVKQEPPDFVVDLNSNQSGHGRTKTGLRPKVLSNDSTKTNSIFNENIYSPSFGKQNHQQAQARKVVSQDYLDFLQGDNGTNRNVKLLSKSEQQKYKVSSSPSKNSNSRQNYSTATMSDVPVAAVAPVISQEEMYSDNYNMFYEDYNYKPKYTEGGNLYKEKQVTENYLQQYKSPSKYCHECGDRYPVKSAKFCCNCGMRRLAV